MKFSKLIKLSALAAAVTFSANAMAEINPKFYVGAEGKYSRLNVAGNTKTAFTNAGITYKNNLPGVGLFVGATFNEYVGLEAGYDFYKSWKLNNTVNNTSATMSFSNVYLDVNGYFPISKEFKLIGSVGVGSIQASTQTLGAVTVKQTKVGPRLGAGAQYNFNDNLGVRAMVRWQNAGSNGGNQALKSMTSVGLGVVYSF